MKFKNLSELLKKFKKCRVCDESSDETSYCFGGDIGIHNNKIYITDKIYKSDFGHLIKKYTIDIKTNKSNDKFPLKSFDFECQYCNKYKVLFKFTTNDYCFVESYMEAEIIKFSLNKENYTFNKNYALKRASLEKNPIDKNPQVLSSSFLKINNYKNLDKKLKSLLLFSK